MIFGRTMVFLAALLALVGCGQDKFRTYRGPNVTSVVVDKSERALYLMHGNDVLRQYEVHLGSQPKGHKRFEGDGRTPEGTYYISHKNPKSQYHLSLGISYPNARDRAFARAAGKPPGGDIFIHGGPPRPAKVRDWTAGCIAVSDREIEEIYAMTRPGTPIFIRP